VPVVTAAPEPPRTGREGTTPHHRAAAPSGGSSRDVLRRQSWLIGLVPLLLVAVVVLLVRSDGTGSDRSSAKAVRPDTATAAPTAVPDPVEGEEQSAGVELCGAPGPPPEQVPEAPDDWAETVRELYTSRSAALVTGQADLLCDVYDPRSPGLESDLNLDAAYARQGVRPDSLVFVVERADELSTDGALVTLEIVDRLEPYNLVDAEGTVVAELPGITSARWQARLVPDATGSEWRFG
jgi:hypothetical protein